MRWPFATEIHVTWNVGDQGKRGLVVINVSFVAHDPKRTPNVCHLNRLTILSLRGYSNQFVRRREFVGLIGATALSFLPPGYAQTGTGVPVVVRTR